MRVAVVAMVLAGCHLVFPLPDPPSPDAPGDAARPRVTGTLVRRWVENDDKRQPVRHDAAFPVDLLSATAVLHDDTTQRVDFAADGTFSFALPTAGTRYRLLLSIGGGVHEIQHDAAELAIAVRGAGRENRAVVTQRTDVTFQVLASGLPFVASTGLWSLTGLQPSAAEPTLDWRGMGSLSGARALLSRARGDALYLLDLTPAIAGNSVYYAATRMVATQVEMTDGVELRVVAPFATVPHERCAHLVAPRAAMATRLSAALPDHTFAGDDWQLHAIPEPSFGPVAPLVLAYASELTASDLDIAPQFANPFPGSALVGSVGIAARRLLKHPQGLAIDLVSSMRTWAPVTGACPPARVDVHQGPGYPKGLTLGGAPLAVDSQRVAIDRARDVIASWTLDEPRPVDLFEVALFEVVVNNGVTGARLIRRIHTTTPSAAIEPELLMDNAFYLLRIEATLGVPNAAAGDLDTIAFPYASVQIHSPMFQIGPL